jgi:site-specific recombinase XerD
LTTKGVAYVVRKYAYLAQLADCSVHTLRHTFGKNLTGKGVSLDRVGHLLGHASLDTTRIYTKPTQADLVRDVEKLVTSVKPYRVRPKF